MKTLLAIGAHYDDCVFGVPGIMLRAVTKHYRVVILSLIGDYSNWPTIGDRHQQLITGTKEISASYGVEMRYLAYRSHLFDVTSESKRAVAEAVAEIQPDLAMVLWPHDQHDDHVVTAQLSNIALRYATALLDKRDIRTPARIFQYDNGPRHTIGFEPDTFVDITDQWPRAIEWLGRFMALVRDQAYQPGELDSAQESKQALAMYRGKTCGTKYAEALKSTMPVPQEIL